MAFLLIGLALLVMKLAGLGPVAAWSWWAVAAPFALAIVWWSFADASGLTKRREMNKMEARKEERRRKNMVNLGFDEHGRRKKQ